MDEIVFNDNQAMELAINEARRGAGYVSPNPLVGCVVLDGSGHLLATGFHQQYGGPHAEVNALKGLSADQLRGARVFVTLEPCAHEGKTPSCAKAIAKLPIKELIFGLIDPNPLVAGQGADIIHKAGIKVMEYQGPLKLALEEVCEHFLVNFREKRPFISLKVASSLDGQMALESGESKWITGEEARQYAHYLRASHDAVLIGQRTLEIDNPSLNVRHPGFPGKKNKVIVLLGKTHSHLRPREMNILMNHQEEDVYFLERMANGYRRLMIGPNGTLVQPQDYQDFDKSLVVRGASGPVLGNSILIEGGARVISSYIQDLMADRLYLFQAPILLGAKGSKAWTEGFKISSMSERISLKNPQFQRLGGDLLITGRLR